MQGDAIHVRVIPHEHQRYPTVGDWVFTNKGKLRIAVSQMSDSRYETLLAIHEIIEAVLCRHAGISEKAVTKFDMAFEARRWPGDTREPGDDPAAPYHEQHVFATKIERQVANALGVDWDAYDKEVSEK